MMGDDDDKWVMGDDDDAGMMGDDNGAGMMGDDDEWMTGDSKELILLECVLEILSPVDNRARDKSEQHSELPVLLLGST
jgi:hypothetical protein